MKMNTAFAVAALALAAASFAQPASAAAPAQQNLDAYKIAFTQREIRDPQMNNEVAVTVAVPPGWNFKDGNIVQWNPVTYGDPARIIYTLIGPKDEATCWFYSKQSYRYDYGIPRLSAFLQQQQAALQWNLANQFGTGILPTNQSNYEYRENTVSDGYLVMKPLSPEDYIRTMISLDHTVSRVQITKSSKPQSIVENLRKVIPELNMRMASMLPQGFWGRLWADTAVVEFTCFKDGKQYEQETAVVIFYFHSPSAWNTVTGANDEVVQWIVSPLVSAFALKGTLKAHELEVAAILGNSLVNPIWSAKVDYLVSDTVQKINAGRIKSQENMLRSMNETSNTIAKMHRDTFRYQRDTMSRVTQGMTDAITGTDRVLLDDGKIYAVPTGVLPERKVPWAW